MRSLAVILVCLGCTAAAAQSGAAPADRSLAPDLLKELVEMPTTESDAGTTRAAEAMAARLTAAGFDREDVRVLGPDDRTGNLVARLRGTNDRARPILLMAHIDVVPARREDWSLDPWTLTERDGWYYGRGTNDNKAGAAMLIANLIRLKREGWRPERDVIVLLTGDEETAQRGIQWLIAHHRNLIDAELAFNTDGGAVTLKDRRPLSFDVQASEKVYADYQLEVTDVGGHSSLARPGNPIYVLSAALGRIGEYAFPLHVTDDTRLWLERSAVLESSETAADMRAVAAVQPDLAAAARLSRSPSVNARLRTTCVATRVDAGHANNALPQHARAVINCRILPGVSAQDVEDVLRRLAGDNVKLTVLEAPLGSPPSPLTPGLLSRLESLVGRQWPGLPVVPKMSTGATDGMYTRSAGIPTYGVSGLDEDPDDVRAHGKDERVGIEAFHRATQFWYELVKAFAGPQAPIGYDDTPMQPDGKWRVHDGRRPQPPIVTPGANAGSAPPPADALVLLGEGSNLTAWQMADGAAPAWKVDNGVLQAGKGVLQTKQEFTDFQLHLEFATPAEVKGDSQDRGNSGVFLLGKFEIQILDSYNNITYPDGQAAAMYGQYPPLVNASRKPGEWQAYDIAFSAPRFDPQGTLQKPAVVTVLHNGVLVHNGTAFWGPTRHRSVLPYTPDMARGPIALQDHGNPVRFRNIWIRPLRPYDATAH